MKKTLAGLNGIGDTAIAFMRRGLELCIAVAILLMIYYMVLDAGGLLDIREQQRIRLSVEYIAASAMLCPTFGLLIDLAIKKGTSDKGE